MRPERIVSLCPSNTEILFALGLDEQIVGVDNHSDYPPKVKELPKVGPDLRINIEKVKALEPDLEDTERKKLFFKIFSLRSLCSLWQR